MEKLKKLLHSLKRISFDLAGAIFSIVLVLIIVPSSIFPDEAKLAFMSLILTKFLLITLGNVHFFITRKLMFSYIKFETEKSWSNNAMIIAMYIIIVWAWARGG
jgi:hypothetical protein